MPADDPHVGPARMLLPLSESYSPEDPSSSHTHSFVPPDLTGRITKLDNQFCAAGSFGDVYRCQYHSEFGVKEVAVKTLRFEFTVEAEDVGGRSNRMRRRELGIWKRLNHPNIVPFLGTVSGFGRLGNASLVSSWMPNGTLQDFLLKYDDKLTVVHRLQLLLGIANGLQYLHSLSIVHGDLTCNNVLLDEKCNARLTDFGYASLVGEIPEALVYLQASTLRPGAVRWAAPEYFSSSPEEMFHCTTKSDIYSFGNIALQVLSGELPWSEFRRDAVVVLHLAKGDKPRRPQSHPIDDQHWGFIERCWSPVQERPSAEHLVLSILHFSRSYPHSQPLCGLLVSSEKSNPRSALSGPLLSSPDIDRRSPDIEVPRAVENLFVIAPNRQHDLLSDVGALSPPRTPRYSPQLTPESDSSSLPPLLRKSHTPSDPGDDHGSDAISPASCVQSNLNNHNGQAVNPSDTVFPQRPPPVHSKSGAAFPPFLNTSIGQDQPNVYPFLYPLPEEHSIYHGHILEIPASGRGDRGATSGSRDGGGGIWSFLSRGFGGSAKKKSTVPMSHGFRLPPLQRSVAQVQSKQQLDPLFGATTTPPSSEYCSQRRSIWADPYDHDIVDAKFHCLPIYDPPPQEAVPRICDHSRSPFSGSHGSGDGTLALCSVRPSLYPRLLANAPHESPPEFALSNQKLSMLCLDFSPPNDSSLLPVSRQIVTNERTAARRSRRKQAANFLCSVSGCGSVFTTSFGLKNHMRKSHDKDWPFQCKWPGCDKGFVQRHSCRYHEEFHCRNRPFTCEVCNKIFPRWSALNRHLHTKRGAECKRTLDASKVSEGLPVPKAEEKGWLGMSGLTPDHVGQSHIRRVAVDADII